MEIPKINPLDHDLEDDQFLLNITPGTLYVLECDPMLYN